MSLKDVRLFKPIIIFLAIAKTLGIQKDLVEVVQEGSQEW